MRSVPVPRGPFFCTLRKQIIMIVIVTTGIMISIIMMMITIVSVIMMVITIVTITIVIKSNTMNRSNNSIDQNPDLTWGG